MSATVTLEPFDESKPTLGHAVVGWIEATLYRPDGVSELIRLTAEQRNFILHFYALGADGRFLNRRAVLRRAKGWGKSPFLGAIALAEFSGPTRFGGWDEEGFPIGEPCPLPWIVIAGVSEAQTKNTMDAIRAMAGNPDFVETYGADVGMTRLLLPNGGKIVPATASASTQEGGRVTFAILDETHHWTESNRGHALAEVVRRNLGKMDGRSIETTNAHEPGHDSTAEKSYLSFLAIREGRTIADGILYDSRQAPDEVDLADRAALIAGLKIAYGDSHWVNLDRILQEVYDPDLPPEQARRFYLNQIVAAADSWVAPPVWHANKRDDLAPLNLGEPGRKRNTGDTVTLGFDGSLTDDSTALVACRVDDGAVFLLAIWERPEGPQGQGWEVPKDQVREAVAHAFAVLDVVGFYSDVAYWETDVDAWRDEYGERLLAKATTKHSIAWDMRGHQMDTTRAIEALHRGLTDREVPWSAHALLAGPGAGSTQAHEVLTRHVLNARRRPNRWGVGFGKETRESPKKVDALACVVLARLARSAVLSSGAMKKRRRGSGRVAGF